MPLKPLPLIAIVALAVSVAGCERPREGPEIRRELFHSKSGDPLAGELQGTSRLTVLYHPDIVACSPVELKVVRALNRLVADFPETRVLTILPRGTDRLRERYGQRLPGKVVPVSQEAYAREGEISPRPRLEVWSGPRLLLLKSVSSATSEEAIYEEILWTRSFTAPLPAQPAR